MPFITQGKANWKFLLIVIILAITVGGGALWYMKRPEQSYRPVEIQTTEEKTIKVNEEAAQLAKCIMADSAFDEIQCFEEMFQEGKYDEKICERVYSPSNYNKDYCNAAAAMVLLAKNGKSLDEQLAKCNVSILEGLCYEYYFLKGQESAEKFCEKLIIEDKDECYYVIGMNKKDDKLCLKINNEKKKNFCLIATGLVDESICKGLYQTDCYLSLAVAKRNEKLCDKIPYSIEKDRCYQVVLSSKAISEQKEESCNNLNFEYRGGCYYGIALDKKDENICQKIGDKHDLNYGKCFMNIAMIKLDENLCEKAYGSEDICYFQLAEIKLNENLCGKTKDLKGLCFRIIATYTNDPSLCEKLQDQDKDDCYYSVVISSKDENLCEKTSSSSKGFCYEGVAVIKKDELLCEKADDLKEMCYLQLAKTKNDEKLCDKAGALKEGCHRYFKK